MKTIFSANRKTLRQCRYVTVLWDNNFGITYSPAYFTRAQREEYERDYVRENIPPRYRINVCPANYSPEHFRARIGK